MNTLNNTPKSILIVTFARCGARYLSAFLGNYFKEFVDFSPKQIDLSNADLNEEKVFYKTHSEYKPTYVFNLPVIIVSRSTEKIVKTFEKEDNVEYKQLHLAIDEFYSNWSKYQSGLHFDYDYIFNNKEEFISTIQSLFNVSYYDSNTRYSELSAGIR